MPGFGSSMVEHTMCPRVLPTDVAIRVVLNWFNPIGATSIFWGTLWPHSFTCFSSRRNVSTFGVLDNGGVQRENYICVVWVLHRGEKEGTVVEGRIKGRYRRFNSEIAPRSSVLDWIALLGACREEEPRPSMKGGAGQPRAWILERLAFSPQKDLQNLLFVPPLPRSHQMLSSPYQRPLDKSEAALALHFATRAGAVRIIQSTIF